MRTPRTLISVGLVALWLLPSAMLGALEMHLAFGHGHHHHAGEAQHAGEAHGVEAHGAEAHHHAGDAEVSCGCAEETEHARQSSMLAQVAVHGHHHEEAEPDDHSHGLTFAPASGLERPSPAVAVVPEPAPVPRIPARILADGPTLRSAPPSLFTSNCSLLL